MKSRWFLRGILFTGIAVLGTAFAVRAAEIPARKLSLIRQATASMKLDQKIQGLIDSKVEARVQKIRIDNSLSDSVAAEVRAVVAGVYDENRAGRDGLDARVYGVLDKYLTEDDLKFAANFNGSDNGKRYREVAPRIVGESVEAGRRWSEGLEPEIRSRLEERFRGWNLRL